MPLLESKFGCNVKYFQLADVRWFVSLGAKFARVVPLRTLCVVLFTLVSQIASILAFFLPLKIVILLGSEGKPRYFPAAFAQIDRDLLVVYLSLATVGFFLLHKFAEYSIERVTERATLSLMGRSQKIVMFENQYDVARNAYQSFSRALAGIFFALLAIGLLAVFYAEMAAIVAGYTMLAAVLVLIAAEKSEAFLSRVTLDINALMNLLSALGFFAVFGFLVIDFVWLSPPNVVVAIVAILLGRQIFNRLSGVVTGLFKLFSQRHKLDVLFFHGKVLLSPSESISKSIWPYLSRQNRVPWIRELFDEYLPKEEVSEDILNSELVWQQPAFQNMGMLKLIRGGQVYFIKLYGEKASTLALHESSLLSEKIFELPSPEWVGATDIGNYHCTLCRVPMGWASDNDNHELASLELRQSLLSIKPSLAITQKYLRSKPTLPRRMDLSWLDLLDIAVASRDQQQILTDIRSAWQQISQTLFQLPLGFHVPTMSSAIWVQKEDGSPVLLHWEQWSLEPVGVGWPTGKSALPQLKKAIEVASDKRPELANIAVELVALSSLIFELERMIQRKNLRSALKLLPRIQSCLSAVGDERERD